MLIHLGSDDGPVSSRSASFTIQSRQLSFPSSHLAKGQLFTDYNLDPLLAGVKAVRRYTRLVTTQKRLPRVHRTSCLNLSPMNPFRAAGDLAHFVSKCILIWSIHRNKSAEGISFLTQAMYLLVFLARYMDVFSRWVSLYNTFMKIFHIASALYVLVLMRLVYPRSSESPMAWRTATIFVVLSVVWGSVLWSFSIFLESTCIIPQLILIRQTALPTVITSYYLLTLGSYRFLYILNWGWRYHFDNVLDPIALVREVVQTAFYADFVWVYYTRQRVKLRDGVVVDSEDYERGWLTRWLAGVKEEREWTPLEVTTLSSTAQLEDEEAAIGGNITLPPDEEGVPHSEA